MNEKKGTRIETGGVMEIWDDGSATKLSEAEGRAIDLAYEQARKREGATIVSEAIRKRDLERPISFALMAILIVGIIVRLLI